MDGPVYAEAYLSEKLIRSTANEALQYHFRA